MAKGTPRQSKKAQETSLTTAVTAPLAPTVTPEFVGKSNASYAVPNRIGSDYTTVLSSAAFRYPVLSEAPLPYNYGPDGRITITDAIILCQKAWCRVPIFANAINTMAELANSRLFFTGGNNESITFFEAWYKRVGGWKIAQQAFLELFRSSNVIFYRVDGKMTPDGAKKMKQLYARAANVDIPLRYILLNPAHIAVFANNLSFEMPQYYRVLNNFEIQLLKNSKNPEDIDVYKSLPKAMKAYFNGAVAKPIPLDTSKVHTVFYKKQDYEPFAVPMGYPVLDSIELKLAMQKYDSMITRTVEHVILLVTMGAKREEGGVNIESLNLLKQAFASEEIGRVLVSDYTTKAEFVIPDLNKVLGAAKYEVVNQDIAQGLLNVISGGTGEKFANMMGKLKVFSEKLNNAQDIYINDFLMPEIKRISKLMGFKSYPTANMVRVTLDDQTSIYTLYATLMQLGVLTPKDGLEAIELGILPEYEDLLSNQQELKQDKDQGLFQPIAGGPFLQTQLAKMGQKGAMDLQQNSQDHQMDTIKTQNQHDMKKTKMTQEHEAKNPAPVAPQINVVGQPGANGPGNNPSSTSPKNGRPAGTKSKPGGKKSSPQGGKASFSMAQLIENTKLHSKLLEKVETDYKEINKVKEIDESDRANIASLVRSIVETAEPNEWLAKSATFIAEPVLPDQERVLDIETLAGEYGISSEAAGILYHSIIEEPQE